MIASFADACVDFAGVRVLDRVSLDVPRGGIQGLVGESGSGKTTLCRTLLGLTPLAAGQARFEGAEVATLLRQDAPKFRRRVQMLLQDAVASLSPRMRLGVALEEPLHIHRLPLTEGRTRLAGILKRLGLPADVAQKYPHQVSGGQARRIGVARALVMQPALIVADEPTAGLDVSVQGDLLNLLLDLREELGLTYLIVSHNLNVVRRITDRTAVMYLGQIVEEAATRSLFARPAHPYSAALLSTNPSLDTTQRRRRILLHGEIPSAAAPPPGCRFHTRCPVAQPRCAVDAPALLPIEPGRSVRCHYPFSLAAAA